jgi:hypothetical protein
MVAEGFRPAGRARQGFAAMTAVLLSGWIVAVVRETKKLPAWL